MKKMVLSGINIFEGGPLSIYYDFLNEICKLKIDDEYEIIAFVHSKEMFSQYKSSKIKFLELPLSRKSYLYRLYYEYYYFKKWSKNQDIEIWISLHDITPNVKAKKRIVYCHNASPFYKPTLQDIRIEPKLLFFSLLYKYLYKINIKKNTYIIVQQFWLKKEFEKKFNVKNVIVSYPIINMNDYVFSSNSNKMFTFLFPSFPRVFKNFEIICEACEQLNKKNYKYKVLLTINGQENKYSKYVYEKFSEVKNISWIGIQNRKKLFELYNVVDCMIFPSKLETWGLPISEFKNTGKKLLLSDLPYAHETVGSYSNVDFFDPYDSQTLTYKMIECINDTKLKGNVFHSNEYFNGWNETIVFLLSD